MVSGEGYTKSKQILAYANNAYFKSGITIGVFKVCSEQEFLDGEPIRCAVSDHFPSHDTCKAMDKSRQSTIREEGSHP